jgi:divalent metal cation (Fe/Co/Zn/Cd) transporter
MTMHFGPNEIMLTMLVHFEPNLNGDELAETVNQIEQAIQAEHPDVTQIFIEASALAKASPSRKQEVRAEQEQQQSSEAAA